MAFAAGAAKGPKHHVGSLDNSLTHSTSTEKLYEVNHIEHVDTFVTTFDMEASGHKNKGQIFRDGKLVLMPAPTRDPRDPLNMSKRHKAITAFFLSFFGALAASAELILGSMLPIFALEYAGYDPKLLLPWSENPVLFPPGSDPLKYLAHLSPTQPPIVVIYMLASLPILMMGLANLVLIPLAISMGRRTILLVCGVLAIVGAIWAGFSQSIGSHLAARVLQALGAGTVESLIPFIIQDMCFFHERNTWISFVFAAQGVIIIAIGFSATHVIIDLNWRWIYWITAAAAAFFLVGVFFTLPETRYNRSRDEVDGIPRDDANVEYAPRTLRSDLRLFVGEFEFNKGWRALKATFSTFFYPQIFFITMLNSAMIATALAAAYVCASALFQAPWSWNFMNLGYLLVSVLIGAIFVSVVTGNVADWIANKAARVRGKREPENQLLNLILPTIAGIVGAVVFGVAAKYPQKFHWAVFLMGLGLMVFGFLGANTVGAVYVLESYPHLAGPALVNIASFRCLIAFALSFKVSEWIADIGYLKPMLGYAAGIAFVSLFLPIVYFYGPKWRKRWPATHLGEL